MGGNPQTLCKQKWRGALDASWCPLPSEELLMTPLSCVLLSFCLWSIPEAGSLLLTSPVPRPSASALHVLLWQ